MKLSRAPLAAAIALAALALVPAARADAPIEPVHFSKIVPLLPDKVDGWPASKPEGSTTSAMGFKVSEASRVYHKGSEDAAESVTIKITDGTGNQFFSAAHSIMPEFSSENTEGYEKGYTLDGSKAMEKYNNESKDGSLTVFVGGRFLVEITTTGLDSNAMKEWWKKIDAKKLAELKP